MSKQTKEEILKIANSWKRPAGLEDTERNGQLIAEEIERGGAWGGVWSHQTLDAAVKRLGAVSEGGKLSYNERVVERVVEKIIEKPVEVERQPTAEENAAANAAKAAEQAKKQIRKELLASMGIAPTEMDRATSSVTTEKVGGSEAKGFKYSANAGAKVITEAEKAAAASAKQATDTGNALIDNWGNGIRNQSKVDEGKQWLRAEWTKLLATTTPEKALPELRKRVESAWHWVESNRPIREDRMGSAVTPHHSRPNHI